MKTNLLKINSLKKIHMWKRFIFRFHSSEPQINAPPQTNQKLLILHSVPNILAHLLPDASVARPALRNHFHL